eukprot:TRINITY_DN3600_c0_g1_i1.p1 TRINITY_DN3600_c0_g1~~TRINITY_DN3600_c0_g1_i1.p1  ORF type:complete len:367 (+),score=42.60 TRINITY_DN3600_c0_g1_i1:2-1102(+)
MAQMRWISLAIAVLAIASLQCRTTALADNIVCPDNKSSCGENTTCCMLSASGYGCCPFPNATCCADQSHCCPQNYTCGEDMQCFPPATAIMAPPPSQSTVCPDGRSVCPESTTCCLMAGGYYGCCPYTDAVCCSDQTYCCPSGNRCDNSRHACLAADGSLRNASLRKQAVLLAQSPLPRIPSRRVELPIQQLEDVYCSDGSRCPDGTTCCAQNGGGFGCCPIANAVCCNDNVHCCPSNLVCNLAAGGCTPPGSAVLAVAFNQSAAVTMVAPRGPAPPSPNQVNCTADYSCPFNTTCCHLDFGAIACCPLPNATCCASTHGRCCPANYDCVENGTSCRPRHPKLRTVPSLVSRLATKLGFNSRPDEA